MQDKRFQLLIFDWDGTLMDSEARIVDCLEMSINELGLESRAPAQLRNVIGLGLPEAVATLFPGADAALMQAFIDRYRYHFLSDHGVGTGLFEGAYETLARLHTAGYLLAVATGKGRRGLDRSLEETGCNELIHISRCADETRSKPHPQMLLEILEVLDVAAADSLMIGDTDYDLQMAANAGTRAAAVSYGVQDRERLMAYNPLICFDRPTDILGWLDGEDGSGSRPQD